MSYLAQALGFLHQLEHEQRWLHARNPSYRHIDGPRQASPAQAAQVSVISGRLQFIIFTFALV